MLIAVGLAFALAGCAHQLPAADAAGTAPAVPAHWSAGSTGEAQPPTDLAAWWQRFGDAELASLVDDALSASPTVQSVVAALRQSRALADVAAAGLLPGLGASASAQRSGAPQQSSSNRFGVGLNASWEPDLFGGTRAGADAAQADVRAAQMKLADAQVSLAAEVALAWIEQRQLQTRLVIAQGHLAAQDDTLQITRWRHRAGLVSVLDVEQASAAAEQTRAQVPLLRASLAQAQHRLAVLTGRAPAGLAALVAAPVPLPPDELALAFPADTLRQRPDVRLAEAQAQAAWARVAQADAARYPSLNLSASLGLQALTLGGLTGGGAAVRSLMAGLSWPVFDGGASVNRVHAQQAALEQAHANTTATVLRALQEVEDALATLQGERDRSGSLQAAARAAATAAALARPQYQAGLIDFRAVLDSQRTLLAAQDSQASGRASLAASHVRLYKALGGGWSPVATEPIPSHPIPPLARGAR